MILVRVKGAYFDLEKDYKKICGLTNMSEIKYPSKYLQMLKHPIAGEHVYSLSDGSKVPVYMNGCLLPAALVEDLILRNSSAKIRMNGSPAWLYRDYAGVTRIDWDNGDIYPCSIRPRGYTEYNYTPDDLYDMYGM